MRSNIIIVTISLTLAMTLTAVASAHSSDSPGHGGGANESVEIAPEEPNADKQRRDTIEQLRRAAEHLKSAGRAKLAEDVTREMLVEEKLLQIRQLQVELEELRATSSADRTVRLRVKIMELQLTRMKELGFGYEVPEGVGVLAESILSALQSNDLIKVLAEPTLATVSGRPATFQTGGEFPIVVPQKDGQVAVEYRHFGTRLDCLAEILDNGRIRVELRPHVSELDQTRTVTVQGISIPGLRTRWVDTAVEMEPGETIILGGLMQSRANASASSQVEETALLVSVSADFGEPVIQAKTSEQSERR